MGKSTASAESWTKKYVASRASKREDGDDALGTMPIDERFIKILYKATRWEMQLNFKFEEHGSHLAIISSLNSFCKTYAVNNLK